MERLRESLKLIAVFLLTIANLTALSSCQDLYTLTTTIDTGSTDSVDQQPSNTTISISQETTTYLPISTTVQTTQEILDSAETGYPNRHRKPSRHNEEEDDDSEELKDHAISYSVHEDEREVPTRPKYVAPGLWAKPPPDKDIPLDFVPTKLHAQVRQTHTVKRLPQQEAIDSAETDEERLNAHRLREVVTNSKVNTVYTEEGYEDSAYDHAGHVRDADFHEGFARKLHDRKNDKHNPQKGKKKKEKHRNLVPDEFKEYNEDYQDHLENNREQENTSDDEHNSIEYGKKTSWEGSEIDPRLVVTYGVRELEEDLEEDAEEAERNERIYQRQQESKSLSEDEADSSESEETRDEDDLKDEENKSVTSKKKKLKSRKEKADNLYKGTKTPRKSEQKKLSKESYKTTEASAKIDPEAPASPHGFVINPLNSEVYSIDQTTLRYFSPGSSALVQRLDEPTTINYSQLFWDYFKASPKPPTVGSTVLIPNSTTPNPLEEHTPVAVATIDGHGPYLLVTKEEETSTLPSTFFGTSDFRPHNLFSDHEDFEPSSVGEQDHRLPEYGNKINYINGVDNVIATSTIATFSSVQPLLLQPLQATSIENTEYSSTTLLDDDVASTPAVMTLNFTEEAYARIDDYQTNPFLSPILDNSNIAVSRNKVKYRVLVRPTPKKPAKPTVPPQLFYQSTPSAITSREEDENKKIREELNAKYNKILDYIKSKQKLQSLAGSKKILLPEDLTLLKPPTPHQRAIYSSFIPTSRPIAEHSSVPIESESSRQTNNWRGVSRDQHRSPPTDPSTYRVNPFIFVHPVRLTYRKNLLPVTKLFPPPPLPLPPPIASAHGTYYSGRQNNNDHLSHVPGKPQQQSRDNTLRLLPLAPDASWRSRRKRSSADTTTESSLVVDGDDENAEESAKKKRHVSQGERRSKGDSRKNVVNGKDHEELLNESPKISGDVVDKEIATRFNETEDDNETSTEDRGDGKVEVEVPSFDYVEEFAENSSVELSTTTEAQIDTKKYPFYNNENVPIASALKYVVDPRTIPRKTSHGMEFYDSRNAYKQCDEIEANLDEVLPEKEEPDPERGPQENLPQLRGLGDKLDCFKAKYFDENPLDNPLFAEESVEEPKPPTELDPVKFASKVLLLPDENDDYVVHRTSKKPERHSRQRQWRRRNPQYEKHESIRVSYKHDPQTGRGRNAYLHSVRAPRLPNFPVRRLKNRGSKPKSPSSTPSSKTEYQTEFYQNQVYEDVMGNIRNMATNGYQVYEVTTLPPSATQIQTASSENAPNIAEDTPNLSTEKNTTDVTTNVTTNVTSSSTKSSEIKGLVPPPKYTTPRRLVNYRKYRPVSKSRISVIRSPSLPHIIAHHHAIKISKRSARAANFTDDHEDKNKTIGKSKVIAVNGNSTVTETTTTTTSTNSTPTMLDLEIEESRLVRTQDQNPLSSTLKIDKRRRKNPTSDGLKNEATPQRVVYTIHDRIKYSKPKLDTRGFGKFNPTPKIDEDVDSRRKEPRYNHFVRKKPVTDSQIKFTTLSTIDSSTSGIETATSSTGDKESSTIRTYRPEDSVAYQSVYGRKIKYPEVEEAESANDAKSEESSEEEDDEEDENKKEKEEEEEEEQEKEEEETENTTNTYRVHEDVNEEIPTTTTKLPSPLNSKEILNFQEYFESDPPGYTEAFPEKARPSNKNSANVKSKPNDNDDEKQDEESDRSKNIAGSWENDSSEKAEEQMEMPIKTKKKVKKKGDDDDDDTSEESSSKEDESSKEDQMSYTTRPSWVDDEKTFYRSFPFRRYKSMIKKESHENEDSEEESKEASKDYVFPWHGDKKSDTKRWLKDFNRYEYPWERRKRLAEERRKRRQRAMRLQRYLDGEDELEDEEEEEEEESRKHERPLYPWEKYKVPSKKRVNIRRDVSPRRADNTDDNTDDNADDSEEEESSSEELMLKKFSSRYSVDVKPTKRPFTARQIGRSIKKFLDDDFAESEEEDTSKEKTSKEIKDHSASSTQKSSVISRGISRGTLVPEDVTQPPRRKSGRRISQYDKDITSSSRYNLKKLKNKNTDDEEEEESRVKSNSEDSESQAEAASSQLSEVTKKASSAIFEPRKKRRRVIPKNNSIDNAPVDNAHVESFIESSTEATKRRRRKPQMSSTTSATLPASADLKTSKSDFAHLRRRYSVASDLVKTNIPNSTEEILSSTIAAKADNVKEETSTPKTRTIEHRSRVSKEKIVRKTTYPGENFDSARENATSAQQKPVKKLRIKVSRRKSNAKRRNDDNGSPNVNEKPIKQKDEGEYYDFQKDDVERSVTSEEPEVKRNENPLIGLGMKKEEVKKINNFRAFDGIVSDEDGDDFADATSSETYALSHLLKSVPPRLRNDRVKTRTKNDVTKITQKWKEQINGKNSEDTAKNQESLLQNKFIKNPQHRLYYYVERK